MLTANRAPLLLLLLTLLGGCRSERVAFGPMPREAISSTLVSPPQQERLPMTGPIPIRQVNGRPRLMTNSCLPAHKAARSQKQLTTASSPTERLSSAKTPHAVRQRAAAKPQHAASDGNAEFFAVLTGVAGLMLVLFGLVIWLGIVLLVVSLLFSLGSFFGGKIGG